VVKRHSPYGVPCCLCHRLRPARQRGARSSRLWVKRNRLALPDAPGPSLRASQYGGSPSTLKRTPGFPRSLSHARAPLCSNPRPMPASESRSPCLSTAIGCVQPWIHSTTAGTRPTARLIRVHRKAPQSAIHHLPRLSLRSGTAFQELKYSSHFSLNRDAFCATRWPIFIISRLLKPPLRSNRTGLSQNFAAQSSRSTCTCGGSTWSAAKKKNRYGPITRTVGIVGVTS